MLIMFNRKLKKHIKAFKGPFFIFFLTCHLSLRPSYDAQNDSAWAIEQMAGIASKGS